VDQFDRPDWLPVELLRVGAAMKHKMRQLQKTSAVSGEGTDCTVAVNLAAGSERRSPSPAAEVAVVNPPVEGTGSWQPDHQAVAGIPGLDSGTGVDSAKESCKSLSQLAKVPIAVGYTLL